MACVHRYSVTQNNVRALKILCATPFFFLTLLCPQSPGTHRSFRCLLGFAISECHLIGIIQCAAFTYGLLRFGVRMEVSPMSVHSLFLFFLSYLSGIRCFSCGTWGLHCLLPHLLLGYVDSLLVVGGLNCSAPCEILVPRSGIKPTSPALRGGSLTTWTCRKSAHLFLVQFTSVASVVASL